MAKKIIAAVLILLAGGGWLYLDHLNKLEKQEAEEMRRDMEKAHARAVAKGRYESGLFSELSDCRAAAGKANSDYLTLHQKPVPHKPGQFTTPRPVMDEAVKILETALVECQQTYEANLKSAEKLPQPTR